MKGGTFPVTIEAECECSLPGLLEVKGDHRVIEIVCYENGIPMEMFAKSISFECGGPPQGCRSPASRGGPFLSRLEQRALQMVRCYSGKVTQGLSSWTDSDSAWPCASKRKQIRAAPSNAKLLIALRAV